MKSYLTFAYIYNPSPAIPDNQTDTAIPDNQTDTAIPVEQRPEYWTAHA